MGSRPVSESTRAHPPDPFLHRPVGLPDPFDCGASQLACGAKSRASVTKSEMISVSRSVPFQPMSARIGLASPDQVDGPSTVRQERVHPERMGGEVQEHVHRRTTPLYAGPPSQPVTRSTSAEWHIRRSTGYIVEELRHAPFIREASPGVVDAPASGLLEIWRAPMKPTKTAWERTRMPCVVGFAGHDSRLACRITT